MNADKYQTSNDVIHSKAHTAQKTNAFCQTRDTNQSPADITTYKSSNPINPIQSNPFNSSIYKSSIESSTISSIQNFPSNPLIAKILYQIINHLKLILYSQNTIAQFHIPQTLRLTQLIFQLLLHILYPKKFLLQPEAIQMLKPFYNPFKNKKEPQIKLK